MNKFRHFCVCDGDFRERRPRGFFRGAFSEREARRGLQKRETNHKDFTILFSSNENREREVENEKGNPLSQKTLSKSKV